MLQIKVILVLYNYFKFLFLSNLLAGLLLCTLTKLQKYISKPNFESRDRILETHIKRVSLYSWLLSQSHVFSIHAVIIHILCFLCITFLSFVISNSLVIGCEQEEVEPVPEEVPDWLGGEGWHGMKLLAWLSDIDSFTNQTFQIRKDQISGIFWTSVKYHFL